MEEGRLRRKRAEHDQRELDEARRIQRKLLPTEMPVIDGWEIAASWQPATGVGGDCYDAIPFGRSRIGLSIADVVGKGIPAALLMSNLQASVRAFATDAAQPAELCQQVNRILCGRIAEDRFISFFYCVIDCELGLLTFANAGHYAPILVRDRRPCRAARRRWTGAWRLCRTAVYRQNRIPIGSGDRLVLFTDGISEAHDGSDQEFGEDRLVDLAREHRACSAPALQARITETVSAFSDGGSTTMRR